MSASEQAGWLFLFDYPCETAKSPKIHRVLMKSEPNSRLSSAGNSLTRRCCLATFSSLPEDVLADVSEVISFQAAVAQLDRAPDYGSDGSGFESWQPHQNLRGDYDRAIVIPFSFGALRSCCELVPPPPHQPSPVGSASATPPQGGSNGGHLLSSSPGVKRYSRARPACSAVRRAGRCPRSQDGSRSLRSGGQHKRRHTVAEGKGLFRADPPSTSPKNAQKVRWAQPPAATTGAVRGKAAPAASERRPSFSAFFLGASNFRLRFCWGQKVVKISVRYF